MDFERNDKLKGKRIAAIIGEGFEYAELVVPKAALELSGAEVEVLGIHRGRVRGMNLTEPTRAVRVDRTIDEASADEYDGLLVPGGFVGPDFLRQSKEARALVRDFDDAGKPIATLCHGPWVLVSAGIVDGRALASWPSLRDDIVHAGGLWRDEAVVRDGNWVSSRGPQDFAEFVPAMIDLFAWGSAPRADLTDSSPAYDRPIPAAMRAARWMPGPAIAALGGALAALGIGLFALRRVA